ncbi:MAG: hypothetical protein ACM3RX_01380 [Methanococcaceae archaeon]
MQKLTGAHISESGFNSQNRFFWPADCLADNRLREKRTSGSILNLGFLLGWRLIHQAKSMIKK